MILYSNKNPSSAINNFIKTYSLKKIIFNEYFLIILYLYVDFFKEINNEYPIVFFFLWFCEYQSVQQNLFLNQV